MKSAHRHLTEVKAFKASKGKRKGTAYVGLGLTAAGYDVIGVTKPADPRFRGGMQSADLKDPPVAEWESYFGNPISAVVLVGDAALAPHDRALARVLGIISTSPGVAVVGKEVGLGLHNENGEGIEHFGYVNGRSQPLFMTDDIFDASFRTDGVATWAPGASPSRVLVPDAAAPRPDVHCGSYFVFRKLEQNVRKFKQAEKDLATRLKFDGDDAKRAGALLIGRFEDGTPLTMQGAAGAHSPVPNSFNYFSDQRGGKCPFFAHIRKLNPRGSGGFGDTDAEQRAPLMPRRGQTYGTRSDNPNDGAIGNKPEGGVGLLFMAFNADIAEQFEFAQGSWANSEGFPQVWDPAYPPGIDPIIGQGPRTPIRCPLKWGSIPEDNSEGMTTTPIPPTVTMKGGEYFFMPSLAFLRAL
jgi:deferrochelatase/peroxidase EfeB